MSYKDRKEELLKRKVGEETSRTFEKKLDEGFFDKYMSGEGVDIGYAGYIGAVPIFPETKGLNLGDPGFDGVNLPYGTETQDYVYTSHVLEHIDDYKHTIKEWFRVIKMGGFLVITVPHKFLYEKRHNRPSRWNGDHRRYYTPASFLKEIEESLEPNSYRIRLLEDGDLHYNYSIGPKSHCAGQCEILLVLQKIIPPTWKLDE